MALQTRRSDDARRARPPWRAVGVALGVLALAGGSSACTKARAEVEPDMPALAVPPPPPRVLPPLDGTPMDAAAPAAMEPPARPRPRQRPDATRAAGNGARPESRADPQGAPASPPDVQPSPEAEASAPATPSLQLAPAGDATSEQNTRRRLADAERSLMRVDYRLLNTDAKAQYDTAKRFITLAEHAIVERNLLFAHTLAEKAATIAAVLQRR